MQRGRVGDADDHALGRLESSDGLPPRLYTGLVDQGESCSGQFLGSGLHVVSVHDLELDARLGGGSIRRPFRGAEAGRPQLGSAAKRRSSGCRRWPHCASSRPVRGASGNPSASTYRPWLAKGSGVPSLMPLATLNARGVGHPCVPRVPMELPSVRRRREPVASAATAAVPAPYDADVTMMSGHRGDCPA